MRRQTLLIPLSAPPEAELQDHSLSEPQQLLGMSPKPPLKPVTHPLIEQVDTKICQPFVRTEPHRWNLSRQALGQRRLPGARKPTQQDQPGLGTRIKVIPACSRNRSG